MKKLIMLLLLSSVMTVVHTQDTSHNGSILVYYQKQQILCPGYELSDTQDVKKSRTYRTNFFFIHDGKPYRMYARRTKIGGYVVFLPSGNKFIARKIIKS